MSTKELSRLEVMQKLEEKRMRQQEAAHPGVECSAGEAFVASPSQAWSTGAGLQAAWAAEQQPALGRDTAEGIGFAAKQVQRLWTDSSL